jgi:cytochrome c biogenesis protein CcmG/thiol:disulfide interchange protein DsbE
MLAAIIFAAMPVVGNAADALNLSDYQGKVVVLDFWASWCVPCRRSFPWMNEMQEKYREEGLVVIAVNLDNQASDAEAFLQKYPAKFSIHYDHERQLARQYAVEAMPSSFLIGRDGTVKERHLGFKVAKTDEYEAAIVAALRSN